MTKQYEERMFLVRSAGLTVVAAAAVLLAGCASTPPGGAPIVDYSSYASGSRTSSASTVPTIDPVAPGTVRDSGRTHVVAPGDTLYNISVRYGLDTRALASLNAVTDPTQLRLGQVLRLPESVKEPREPIVSENVRVTRVPEVSSTVSASAKQEPETVVLDPSKSEATTPAINNTPNQDIGAPKVAKKTPAVVPGTRMLWPVQGEVVSDFAKNGKGLDIAATKGDVVVSAAAGQVLFVGELKGYEQLIIIKHSPTIVTAYGHVDRITVKLNDRVRAGQKIAEVSGSASQPVLRFEVREKGQPVDPKRYLNPKR